MQVLVSEETCSCPGCWQLFQAVMELLVLHMAPRASPARGREEGGAEGTCQT